jgi:hypothetical protein
MRLLSGVNVVLKNDAKQGGSVAERSEALIALINRENIEKLISGFEKREKG